MFKRLLGLLLLLAAPAAAQDLYHYRDISIVNAGGQLQPIGNATITVCQAGATGIPCTPTQPVFHDLLGTEPYASVVSDANGNFDFYIASGNDYVFTVVSSNGSLSGGPFTFSAPCVVGTVSSGCGTGGGSTSNGVFKGPEPWHSITAYMPTGGCDNGNFFGGQNHGNIQAGSAILTGSFGALPQNGCGIFVAGAGPLSSLATPGQGAAPNPNVIGPGGSTTVHYEIVAMDSSYGTSAASAPITVTNAPSNRTPTNYVGIYWTSVANAVGYLVYTDQNGGGSYVPLNYSFMCSGFGAGNICGLIDKGPETNTWNASPAIWPIFPPSSPTPQALITTMVSGSGTSSITLAATATTQATNVFVLPDNSMFFQQAIAAAAADNGLHTAGDKGTVFVPKGLWITSTIPFPSNSGGNLGVRIVDSGQIELFGLPVYGGLAGGSSSGSVSIQGDNCGNYNSSDYAISGCIIGSYAGAPSLGALFVVNGTGASLDLEHITLNPTLNGVEQGAQGSVSARDVNFSYSGTTTGIMYQVDNNAFFSTFNHINWNDGANGTANNIQMLWFLGLTNSGPIRVFSFTDNSFIDHTIRVDLPFPGGSSSGIGEITFQGFNSVEGNFDPGFINMATNNGPISVTLDNVLTGDANAQQHLFYGYNNIIYGENVLVHGQTTNYSSLSASAIPSTTPMSCRVTIYDNPNQGGSGFNSIGYWQNLFGNYAGCDLGATFLGYDVQTTEVLTGGGNDSSNSLSAGEQMIGHVFRRPFVTASAGSGSLTAGTYYIKATILDVAGRQSASSPEVFQAVGGSGAVVVSVATQTFFPASCNIYFGTSPGGETNFFNSTSITNGTCSFTLNTVSGASSGTPPPVGNAMDSWLTEENNLPSCLFCGSSNGGARPLGVNLNQAQYNVMNLGSAPGLYVGGLGYFFGHMQAPGLQTSGPVAGAVCQDALGNFVAVPTLNCFPASLSGGTTATTSGTGACSSISTIQAGSLGGEIRCNGSTGSATLTLSPGFVAPNGYYCFASDANESPAVVFVMSGESTGGCTMTTGLNSITSTHIVNWAAIAF